MKKKYTSGHIEFLYELILTSRKSVGIQIRKDGTIQVRAPKQISAGELDEILGRKAEWIQEKFKDVQDARKTVGQKVYKDGTGLLLMDRKFILSMVEIRNGKNTVLRCEAEQVIIETSNTSQEWIRQVLEKWYREQAKSVFQQKVHRFAAILNVAYGQIHIKNQQSRWGSCSSGKNLNFNWRILMAPEYIVDYLVVHELSHLIEMNHSKNFYEIVGKVIPAYREAQTWLKINGRYLEL